MATLATDGSRADVQAKINAAVDGDTITFPSGSFNWTSGVTSNKYLKFQGNGSGRAVARSHTAQSFGTGLKTFTLKPENLAVYASSKTAQVVPGAVLRIFKLASAKNTDYMLGTVITYNSVTEQLVINVTSSTGTGTHRPWVFATEPLTTIVNNGISSTVLFELTESTAGSVEMSGVQFNALTASPSAHIRIVKTTNGKVATIHDNWFHRANNGDMIALNFNRLVVWNCTFTFDYPVYGGQGIGVHAPYAGAGDDDVWTSVSTMGANDTSGFNNIYVEDCDFHAIGSSTDVGDNAKCVVRRCLGNHAGFNSHGRDSGSVGLRHLEVYDCEFVFEDLGVDTMAVGFWVNYRAGTGVVHNNIMPEISSGMWSDKPEVQFQFLILGGPPFLYWSGGDGGVPDYPAPRQCGFGRVTGVSAGDTVNENGYYFGDSEPIHVWGNTGSPVCAVTGGTGVDPDDADDYMQLGRDYFLTEKSGWTRKAYPHPIRGIVTTPPEQHSPPVISPGGGEYSVPINVTISFA